MDFDEKFSSENSEAALWFKQHRDKEADEVSTK